MSTDFQTFCISRRFGVRQATLWQAWTDPETKRRWFAWEEEDGDWRTEDYRIDIRTGGTESARQVGPIGTFLFDARYIAVSAPDRMVYSYTMATPDALLSASLSTVVLTADEAGTRLEYTEQAVFLDGGDRLETRRAGTEMMFERMARVLEREAA